MSQEEIQIPKGWIQKNLRDVIDNFEKYNPTVYPDKKFKYIEIGSVSPDKKIINFKNILGRNAPSRARNVIRKNDVIYGTTRPYYRNVVLIPPEFDNEICSTGFCVLRSSIVYPKFLFYYMLSNLANDQIVKPMRGGSYPAVSNNDVISIKIPLPSLDVQKKIVQKLDHIFGQLEEKKKQIISRIEKFDAKKINENYKNHLLKLAFDGTLTGEKSEIIDGVKVPKEWKIKKFKDFTNVIRGSSPRPKGDSRYFGGEIPWIKISDITASKGKYVFSTKEGLTNEGVLKSRFLKSETLILTTSMLIAMPKILKMDGCIHDGFLAILDIDKEIDTEFLYYYFLAFRGKIEQQSSEGSAIKNINTEVVKNLEIHIPSLETQKKIVAKLDQKFADWENHKQELENIQNQHELIKKHLNSLSSSILNDAFSGKLVN